MRTPVFVFRTRRWLRRRNPISLLLLCLILGSQGVLFLLAGDDRPMQKREMEAAAVEVKQSDSERAKIETRMEAAVAAQARSVAGNDLSSLPALELPPPLHSLDGTTFRSGDDTVRLYGIEGPGAEDICLDEAGRRWSCGLQARAALHNAVARQALRCRPRRALSADELSASCEIAGKDGGPADDLARVLVAQGWARPGVDGQPFYASETEAARSKQAGLWRGGWTIMTPRH